MLIIFENIVFMLTIRETLEEKVEQRIRKAAERLDFALTRRKICEKGILVIQFTRGKRKNSGEKRRERQGHKYVGISI